ncbi:hypothetical protein CAC42_2574 [Sphaceloma murrayae]|uniref:BRCT domain-containing protein n=1 Tax=Sphaceloma murrayae TaxID=2082308 RepID=A0A2K1QWG8_9PEZI|nr:hypothetical protein CAC42_2574 [Sphaceloma murrayae]
MADGDAQRPLSGVVICGTSLSQDIRSSVKTTSTELGASHKLDLTSDVTHLLCGRITSEKYRHVAKHRPDIHVLQPEWLFKVRDAWMEGGEVNVKAITEEYRLPTFHHLNICVTGFNDGTCNASLSRWRSNGAQYHGDLTREVTHLVTAKPEGAKYERARIWNIKTVSLAWFEQSHRRGMVLDESCFDPLLPSEQQGRGSYEPKVKNLSEAGRRLRPEDDDSQANASRRKMRRTASTRLNSQSQTLWADLSVNEESEIPPLDESWTQSVDPSKPFQQTVETQPVGESIAKSRPSLSRNASSEQTHKGIFSGWICLPYGYDSDKEAKLRHYLVENGGIVASDMDAFLTYDEGSRALLLPAAWVACPSRTIPLVSSDISLVTEWWVERSLSAKKALNPEQDVLSTALVDLPSNMFKDVVVSTSGLGNDIRFYSVIVRATGGVYKEELVRDTTVLIHDLSKMDLEKPVYCADRNIDVVQPVWFLESLRKKELQPKFPYYLPDATCEAISRIRDSRRKEADRRTDEDAPSGDTKSAARTGAREPKKLSAPRMSGFKRQSYTPALPLVKTVPPAVSKTQQPPRRPAALKQMSQNSQERSKTQPTLPAFDEPPAIVTDTGCQPEDDKENSQTGSPGQPKHKPSIPVQTTPDVDPDQASAFVSNFLARRQNSGSSAQEPAPRGKRKLGRAPSGSTMTSFIKPSASPFVEDEEGVLPSPAEAPQASQQIAYEAPGAAEHRRLVSEKLGTAFEEGIRKAEVTGRIKDADLQKSISERVRGRRGDVRPES